MWQWHVSNGENNGGIVIVINGVTAPQYLAYVWLNNGELWQRENTKPTSGRKTVKEYV